MTNKSVSDYVAASMDAVLKSSAHKSLFGSQYKFASDQNDAETMCAEHNEVDSCSANDSLSADDNDAKKKKFPFNFEKKEDSCEADDDNDAKKKKEESEDSDKADDVTVDNAFASDEEELEASASFDVAIDSLLTASAALDSVGMEKSSSLSLKLASLVIEAKKKEKDSKKEDMKKKKEEEKKKSDSNAAKDKLVKEKEKSSKRES